MKKIAECGDFKIYLTKHAIDRANQRKMSYSKIASLVLWLGDEKLAELSGEDVIIQCETLKASVVATILENKVKIITVVPNGNTFKTDFNKVRITLA